MLPSVVLYYIPANPSAFCGIFPHLNHVFRIRHYSQNIRESQILQNMYIDSQQMDVKSLIQGTLSQSKDKLWVVMFVRGREKKINTGDGQMSRTRERPGS